MEIQTFPHNIVKELHDRDSAIRVVVEQLGVHSGCEEFSKGKERGGGLFTIHYVQSHGLIQKIVLWRHVMLHCCQ